MFQYPNTAKPYTSFTDASHHAYSGVLSHVVQSPDDLKLIACTSGSFSDIQLGWSATEKEAFAVYHSVLKFNLYLRGAEHTLCCDHKPLESFLSKGIKIPKLNKCSVELADYNLTFIHIKGKNNVLVNAISGLKH